MKIQSELFEGVFYEAEDCIHIPNMLQNYKYLNNGGRKDLVDIICGSNNRMIFVWWISIQVYIKSGFYRQIRINRKGFSNRTLKLHFG